jgi:predicted transcriptional regulator
MTTLLDQGIQAIRELPAERQDMAGEILLTLAASAPRYELTPEQIEDLKLGIAQADRGEFASDEEVARTWQKFGL